MEVQQTAPQFFADSLFEGPSRYQTPESNVDKTEASSDPLAFGMGDFNTPAAPMEPEPGGGEWENEAANLGFMADGTESRMFLEEPGFYNSPETGEEDAHPQIEVAHHVQAMTAPSTRRPSSSQSVLHNTSNSESPSTGVTLPEDEDEEEEAAEREEAPKKRTVVRKTKKNPTTAEEEERRSKFLERNRIAASKCREKKKLYMSELEVQAATLETNNQALHAKCAALTSEVTYLKHRLMQHAKCNDERIDSWIENEARRFVTTANDAGGQPCQSGMLPAGQPQLVAQPQLAAQQQLVAQPQRATQQQRAARHQLATQHQLTTQGPFSMESPPTMNNSMSAALSTLPSGAFDGGLGPAERHGGLSYSTGKPPFQQNVAAAPAQLAPRRLTLQRRQANAAPVFPSPTEESFPLAPQMGMKSEPTPEGMNYDYMPDSMLSSDQPATYGGGGQQH